jgi:hypothetical protein
MKKDTGKIGDKCFWYAFGMANNTPASATFLLDLNQPEAGAILFTEDTNGGEARRSVKHMDMEGVATNDRRRNGGWSFERLDLKPDKPVRKEDK